jgi:hypothetical protein
MAQFGTVYKPNLKRPLRKGGPLIYLNSNPRFSPDHRGMKSAPEERSPGKDEPPKLTRSEEVLRIIEEYAAGLREIIKKLR